MQAVFSSLSVWMTVNTDFGRHTCVIAVKHSGLLLGTQAILMTPSGIVSSLFSLKYCCALQVLPTLPLHKGIPFARYTPVEMPQYSVDFTSFEPMEPQVEASNDSNSPIVTHRMLPLTHTEWDNRQHRPALVALAEDVLCHSKIT